MRAQASMEYIIIISVVVLIALFTVSTISDEFSLFSFSDKSTSRVNEISNLLKEVSLRYVLDSDGVLQVSLRANTIRTAKSVNLRVYDEVSECVINFGSVSTSWVSKSTNCSFLNGTAGDFYNFNVTIDYLNDYGLQRASKGLIIGNYDTGFTDNLFTGFMVVTEDINASGYSMIADYFIGDGSQLTNLVTYNSTYHNHVFSAQAFNPLQFNPLIKRQFADLSTNDNLSWTETDMQFELIEGINYYLICDVLFTGQVATTGQVINLTTNSSTSNVNIMYDTWSSATAKIGRSTTAFNTALIGTGSGAAVIKPNLIIADFKSLSNGTLKLLIRSEVSGSDTLIKRGSVCELHNVGQLQETPINNGTDVIPAIKSQRNDVSTTSNTVWSDTNLSFNLESNKIYSLKCDILYTSTATTTGQAINLTTTATTSNVNVMYDTWSSATGKVGLSATAFNTALVGTGSGGTLIKPNNIIADFETLSSGVINLTIRSEISGSATNLLKGSVCYLYDLT